MLESFEVMFMKSLVKSTFDSHNTKRVSYILSTKNRAKLLVKAIEKTKKLLGKNDELVIIDGASSDDTIQVIMRHKDVVSKFISEPDLNPPHAANKGILLARGKYIKLVTDDDRIYKGSMERAIQIMERHPDIDILDCGGVRYIKSTKKVEVVYKDPGINYGKKVSDIFYYGASGMGYVIRRSSLAKIGVFPVELIGDITFLINGILNGAIVKFCRIKLFRQVIHDTNVSLRPEMSEEIYKVVKKYAPRKFYIRYAFNYFLWRHPNFKPIFFPLIFLFSIYKQSFPTKKNSPKKIVWDGGFS